MKMRPVWFGMLMGLCIDNAEAAEKRLDERWTTQIFNRLSQFWEQTSDSKLDSTKNDSLESVENLTKKQDQLKREIKELMISHRISREYTPFEALYNVVRQQQEEIQGKTNERNRLTFQIAQKMDISGDNLKPEAQAGEEEKKA